MKYQPVAGKIVMVIGCNSGLECAYFVGAGAKMVHGLDVVDNIGSDYSHPTVSYIKASAENMPAESDFYDLVYCFATMEHVPDIESAFKEMGRVARPGGLIYSLASPLWNSRNGHHYPQYFGDYPWAHLRLSPEQALGYLEHNQIEIDPANCDRKTVVDYMYDNNNFNMIPSDNYVAACNGLHGYDIIRNGLDLEPEETLDPSIWAELESKGYGKGDVLAVTHTFIARKKRPLLSMLGNYLTKYFRP